MLPPKTGSGFVADVSFTLTARSVGIIFSLLSAIVVARYVGPGGKGMLAVLAVVSGLAVQSGNLGLNASSAYFAAKSGKSLSGVVGNALWFGGATGITLALAILAISAARTELLQKIPFSLLLVTVITVPFLLISLYFQHILLGLQRIRAYNLVDVAAKAGGFLFTVILLSVWHKGVAELVLLAAMVSVLSTAAYVTLVFDAGKPSLRFDGELLGSMLGYGLKAYMVSLLAFLVIRVDMLLVNYFLGPAQAGLYSVAVVLGDLLLMIPGSVAVMLFPRITSARAHGSALTARVARHTVILMGVICGLASVAAGPAISALFGRLFLGSIAPFLWLLPGIFFLGVETVIAQDLAARGYPAALPAIWAVALAGNLALNVLLIPIWGISGAALASTAAYTFVFLAVLAYHCYTTDTTPRAVLLIQLADLRLLRHVSAARPGEARITMRGP